MPIRIALVDDHEIFRGGLRGALGLRPEMNVVAEASSGRMLFADIFTTKPDLVILDLGLPGMNGFAITREVRRYDPNCKVLILSVYDTDDNVREALAAGAHGYALKDQSADEIVGAILTVMAGGQYLAPKIPAALLEEPVPDGAPPPESSPLGALSTREREVFDLVLRGFTNVALSLELHISVKTVESHRMQINKKLGVHSTADLVRFGAKHRLLTNLT